MNRFHLILLFGLLDIIAGLAEDFHVEQIRAPYVSSIDLGTHMTSGSSALGSELGEFQADFGPYGRSVKHEVHEEHRIVNGEPVYEKRDERRYEDGRLVHHDGHERGDPNTVPNLPVVIVPGSYRSSASRSSSSRFTGGSFGSTEGSSALAGGSYGSGSNYRMSGTHGATGGSLSTIRGNDYRAAGSAAETTDNFENRFSADVQRLRERLHQGTAVIHAPAQTTSVRDEKHHESHFVDGQQVYRRNEERRYEDGRLVHNVADEDGSRSTANIAANAASSQQSTVSRETANAHVRSGSGYETPTDTSYRASYWRPGPQERRVSTTQRQTSSSTSSEYRPRPNRVRITNAGLLTASERPAQVSQETSSTRFVAHSNQPSYRPSYTPARTVERIPQSQQSSSTHIGSNLSQRQLSEATYQLPGSTIPASYRSEYESSSHTGRPQPSEIDMQQNYERIGTHSESQSANTERRHSAFYGSGYVQRPQTTTTASPTVSRITDTYSVPYSIRSSSYQPSQFANYSAWSHWRSESPVRVQTTSSNTTQNRYESGANSSQKAGENVQMSVNRNAEAVDTSQQTHTVQQSQHVRALRPGFLYDDHLDHTNEIDRSNDHRSAGANVVLQTIDTSPSPYSPQHAEQNGIITSSTVTGEHRNSNANVAVRPGSTTGISFTVKVGENENVRLNNIDAVNTQIDEERYDISPIVDGTSSFSQADNKVGTTSIGRTASSSELSRYYSTHGQDDRSGSHVIPASGSAYDRAAYITNRTQSTITSQIQPLVSSYKIETRSSRRYLNGKLVSETRLNKYYENGVLVHENKTERSRDEMLTDGVNVGALDLSMDDLASYGVLDPNAVPLAHSQRFDLKQEKEFVDGNQVYESTHERRFQDGELIHEDHDEKDQAELASLGRTIYNQDDAWLLGIGREMSGGGYTSNFIENRNYGNSFDTGIQEGYRSGNRQRTGVGETVTINVTPVTKTRKTEIRREQEFQNGQQTYDLRHERQFTDGSLIHEEYSEKGPDELGTGAHRDALQDILSGRTLTTASESNYRPASTANSHSQHYQGSSYSTQTQRDSNNYVSEHQRGNSGSTQRGQNTAGINPNAAIESSRVNSQLGTNLLNSGARTFVIGDGGIGNYESLHSASGVSTGSRTSGTKYDGERSEETEDESYSSFGAGTESQTGSISYSNEISSSSETSHRGASVGTYGTTGYDAFGNFEAYAGGDRTGGRAISHQREMEVEEHYENGQLVRGREAEKEWKNNELQKHEERVYGQGEAIRGRGTSVQVSPGLTSSSSFGTYGGSAGGSTIFGATGSFGAYSPQSGADYNAQPSVYGSHNGYQSQSSAFNIESSSSGSQGATYGIPGYPGGGIGGVTHRREMEVEEHYENGQLVHGREEEKEWKNDNLLKHERRQYGEENSAQPSSSALTSTSSSGVSSSRLFHDSVEGQCSARPCNNGASCVTGTRGYLCVCTFGFRGLRCDEAYCPTRYCRHDGICHITSDGTHSCSCPVTHTGPRCENRVRDRGTQ